MKKETHISKARHAAVLTAAMLLCSLAQSMPCTAIPIAEEKAPAPWPARQIFEPLSRRLRPRKRIDNLFIYDNIRWSGICRLWYNHYFLK